MTYNENQMKATMKFLRKHHMVTTTKTLGGVLVTICNYDTYQNPKSYENPNESPNESPKKAPTREPLPTYNNKNVKECKNDKEKKKYKKEIVLDLKDAVWKKSILISKAGTDSEYLERVEWWYENAKKDEDWKATMRKVYTNVSYTRAFAGMKMWLLKTTANRKSDLNKTFRGFCEDKFGNYTKEA